MTAAARLNLLLPWINGAFNTEVHRRGDRPEDGETAPDLAAIRRVVAEFMQSFDGSAAAGYLTVLAHPRPGFLKPGPLKDATDDELEELEIRLQVLLEQGFGEPNLADVAFPAGSLRFAVRGTIRPKPNWRNSVNGKRVLVGGAKALRDYRSAGAYVLQVHGSTVELVPFLVAHLLTQPSMVAVRRCPAPGCKHFLVTAPAARGRPQTFCSGSCRVRNAEHQQQQDLQRRTKR